MKHRKIRLQVEINLRDYAAFEDLATQKDIGFEVLELIIPDQQIASEPETSKPVKPRKRPVRVTGETVTFVKDLSEEEPWLSNQQIADRLPEHLRITDNPVSLIRRGGYDHLLTNSKSTKSTKLKGAK